MSGKNSFAEKNFLTGAELGEDIAGNRGRRRDCRQQRCVCVVLLNVSVHIVRMRLEWLKAVCVCLLCTSLSNVLCAMCCVCLFVCVRLAVSVSMWCAVGVC
jgi:hypothetical protein